MKTIDSLSLAVIAIQPHAVNAIREGLAPFYTVCRSRDLAAYLTDPDWILVADNVRIEFARPSADVATASAVDSLRAEATKLQAQTCKRLTEINRAINELRAITNEVPA